MKKYLVLFLLFCAPSWAENWYTDSNGTTSVLVFNSVVSGATSYSNALYIPATAQMAAVTIRGGTATAYQTSVNASTTAGIIDGASVFLALFPTKTEADFYLANISKQNPTPIYLTSSDGDRIKFQEYNTGLLWAEFLQKWGTYIIPVYGCRYMVLSLVPNAGGTTFINASGLTVRVNIPE